MIEKAKDPFAIAHGLTLSAYRRQRHMGQEALAARASLSTGSISMYETGQSVPTLKTIYGICTALNVPLPDYLSKFEKHLQTVQKQK